MKPIQNKPPQKTQHLTQLKGEIFHGPLPHPETLEHYERIQPGFADRIIKLSESEANHRRGVEKWVLGLNFTLTFIGQIFAVSAIGGVLYVAYYAFEKGHANQAATVVCGVLVGVGAIFIRGRKSKK